LGGAAPHPDPAPATPREAIEMQVIEVYADVWCPFTHVGLRRLVEARAERGREDVGIRVRPWPLEIVNGEALAPDFVAEEVEQLRATVAADLFTGFRPRRFPRTTLPALHLAEAAYEAGMDVGEAVSLELRDRLFEWGENLEDPSILARIANEHGLTAHDRSGPDPVLATLAEGRARGVVGSPHFFRRGEGWFCPALDISRVDGHLVITADPEGFTAFLERLLADPPT